MSEDRAEIDALVQLSHAVQTVLADIAAEHDMSVTQMRLLAILRSREPPMLELAGHMNLTKSSMTGLIDRAERRGLVERTTSPADGRAVHVRLTPAGRRLTKKGEEAAYAKLAALLEPLAPRDRAKLATLARTAALRT